MRNKLKGLAFLCMAVALPLTAQNAQGTGTMFPDKYAT